MVNNTKVKPLKERKQIMVEFIQDPTIDQRFIGVVMDLVKYELENNNKGVSPNTETVKLVYNILKFTKIPTIPFSISTQSQQWIIPHQNINATSTNLGSNIISGNSGESIKTIFYTIK
ncbi:hypothetical protein ACTA71_009613 [Dictyostelium dimigraforme]